MIIMLRHGRTEANAQGLLQGRIDPDLDELGRRQAAAAAAAIGPIDRLISSPLARAQQTAAAFGMPVEIDSRYIELDYGDWEGTPVRSVPNETWAQWRSDFDFAPPGESLWQRCPPGYARHSMRWRSRSIRSRQLLLLVTFRQSRQRRRGHWESAIKRRGECSLDMRRSVVSPPTERRRRSSRLT